MSRPSLRAALATQCSSRTRDVVAALAERRNENREDIEPEVEVGRGNGHAATSRVQITIRRRDDAHVDVQAARSADALELALLQHPQQLGLRLEGSSPISSRNSGAAVRELEAAAALLDRRR